MGGKLAQNRLVTLISSLCRLGEVPTRESAYFYLTSVPIIKERYIQTQIKLTTEAEFRSNFNKNWMWKKWLPGAQSSQGLVSGKAPLQTPEEQRWRGGECTRPTSPIHGESDGRACPPPPWVSRPVDHAKYSGKLLRCNPSASVLFTWATVIWMWTSAGGDGSHSGDRRPRSRQPLWWWGLHRFQE